MALRIILVRRNKAKRLAAATAIAAETTGNLLEADAKITHSYAFEDLTDIENPDFRVCHSFDCIASFWKILNS